MVAGAGVPVAKHGNKAASSLSGSSEVLQALGVKLNISPAQISRCIRECGVGFMFAANHHRAVANVAPARQSIGIRTIFNVIGPLSNPASATRQLMGVYDRKLIVPIAQVMQKLGVTRAWVVAGADGLDELTTTGPTYVGQLIDGAVTEMTISPEDAGLPLTDASALKGGTPPENAIAIESLLTGAPGAFRDITLLNAAAALLIAEQATTLIDGVALAKKSIDSGAARSALDGLIRLSNTSEA